MFRNRRRHEAPDPSFRQKLAEDQGCLVVEDDVDDVLAGILLLQPLHLHGRREAGFHPIPYFSSGHRPGRRCVTRPNRRSPFLLTGRRFDSPVLLAGVRPQLGRVEATRPGVG